MRWLDGITYSNRRESGQTLGDGEQQGSLACSSLWGHKESDTTEQLNNNNKLCSIAKKKKKDKKNEK